MRNAETASKVGRTWGAIAALAVAGAAILLLANDQSLAIPVDCMLNADCGCAYENSDCEELPEPGHCDENFNCVCNPGFAGDNCELAVPNEAADGARACGDGLDNDNDTTVDCADTDCADDPLCSAAAPAMSPGALGALVAVLATYGFWSSSRARSRRSN